MNERIKYKKEIDALIGEWTKSETVADITEKLKKADVPCSAVPDFGQVCDDPQIKNRKMIIEVNQRLSGKVKVPGSVFKFSRTPGDINLPASELGEHNPDVYSEMLNITKKELEELANEGVI
jgi:crotonobetainyl-CoA:carnitine CoA-transferase CaiB-like acyl-CoA transferase